ncbi:hypothetical protein MDAP_001518 [Mitosporidium daphniae]
MVRFKNRYFLFRINGQAAANPITQHDFLYTLKNSLVIMLGNHGYALTLPSLSIKYFDAVSQVGILRVSRAEYRKSAPKGRMLLFLLSKLLVPSPFFTFQALSEIVN